MKINQLATAVNEAFAEYIGESELVAEDLSNWADIGKKLTPNDTITQDMFDNAFGTLIDKCGKVIFDDMVMVFNSPKIFKDAWTYGGYLQKIRVSAAEYDNPMETMTAYALEAGEDYSPYTFSPLGVESKIFNAKNALQKEVSFTRKQVMSAFESAAQLNSLISTLENHVRSMFNMSNHLQAMRLINSLIAESVKANNGVVNILSLYKAIYPDSTVTVNTALTDKEFLRFCVKTIKDYKDSLNDGSILYNSGGYFCQTPDNLLHFCVLSRFSNALETYLMSDTYHESFVKLANFEKVGQWQGIGTNDSFEARSTVNAYPVSETGKETKTAINQSGIVAVMYDDRAAAICNEQPEVETAYTIKGKFYNNIYTNEQNSFADPDENVIVFVIADND